MLLGAGPRFAWARSLLAALAAPADAAPGIAAPEIVVIEGPSTREALVALVTLPIDALVLVDHAPFAGTAIPEAPAVTDAMRGEAQRAVLAFELARRAARIVPLAAIDADRWAASLAALAGLPLPDGLPPPPATPAPPAGAATALPLMAPYLVPLFAAAAQTAVPVLAWPREAFLDGDAPGECLPAAVEVAGRARILAYGPYLPLPAGAWRARAFLGFSRDVGKMPFILEADSGGAVSRGFFEVERGGIFSLDLDFQVTDALHPVELRLISQDSALEGQLSLIEVTLESVAAA